MYAFSPTTTAGRPLLTVDFTELLPSGVTLSSVAVTCAVHDGSEVPDATPSARLDGSVVVASPNASQWFHNGVENADYVLTFLATFSDGQIEPVQAKLSVEKYL